MGDVPSPFIRLLRVEIKTTRFTGGHLLGPITYGGFYQMAAARLKFPFYPETAQTVAGKNLKTAVGLDGTMDNSRTALISGSNTKNRQKCRSDGKVMPAFC